MNYDNWKLLVGEEEFKEWGGKEYRFLVGTEQQDEIRIIEALQSQTPIRHFIEKAAEDTVIRALTFLSYYLINPTFKQSGTGIGADFFWFPLDRLNDNRYNKLKDKLGNDDQENEDDESDGGDNSEDAKLPDFPVMSTVSSPIIEAAVSESYAKQANRKSEAERQEILQERIKQNKREMVEEVEEWLNEGMGKSKYPEDLSKFADVVGMLPAVILLELLVDERDRIDGVYEIFRNLNVEAENESESGPEFLLRKLNALADDYPVFENPAIEAFCMDENKRDCEFHVTKSRGLDIDGQLEQCEYCGSEMFRVFRTGLNEKVEDAWMMGLLPELVVARILEGCDWTKEVLPHRLVQMKKSDGTYTSSIEVDVAVRTEDDRALFFEVTTQRSPLDRLTKKKNKFINNDIEYDGIIQISPLDNDAEIPFGDNVVATSGWMINGLETQDFIEDLNKHIG